MVRDEGVDVSEDVKEAKIVFRDGEETRVLRGTIEKEDEKFVWLRRQDGIRRINKDFIIVIEEGGEKP